MITNTIQIRTRYSEVDRMGYVYHSNYLDYCHQSRTEFLRRLGIHDNFLEQNNIILPVISFHINYKIPAHYDELLNVKTIIRKPPEVRFNFEYEISNEKEKLVCTANSTVVFADMKTRAPLRAPEFIVQVLEKSIKANGKDRNTADRHYTNSI